MIGFVMVGTNNLNRAIDFYDILLETINLSRSVTNEKYAGYSSKDKPKDIEFYVTNPVNKIGIVIGAICIKNSMKSQPAFPAISKF